MSELFGAHAPFVWGSLAVVAVGIAIELWTLRRGGR
jgi:hypothetical protein